jgi:hypothetical protein
LSVTPFAYADGRRALLHDSQFALLHDCSLAQPTCELPESFHRGGEIRGNPRLIGFPQC